MSETPGHKGAKSNLTQEQLKQFLRYNPKTGEFTRIAAYNNVGVGKKVGWTVTYGAGKKFRVKVGVNGDDYMAHRLAWLYMTGEWPKQEIDHINEDGADNRWDNLREASPTENLRNRGPQSNNTTGYKGTCFVKSKGFYIAGIKVHGKRTHLGCFKTAEEAHQAYCEAAKKYHGEFAKTR